MIFCFYQEIKTVQMKSACNWSWEESQIGWAHHNNEAFSTWGLIYDYDDTYWRCYALLGHGQHFLSSVNKNRFNFLPHSKMHSNFVHQFRLKKNIQKHKLCVSIVHWKPNKITIWWKYDIYVLSPHPPKLLGWVLWTRSVLLKPFIDASFMVYT